MGLDNPIHIVFLVVILLLLFGARRLPEIGRSLGAGMREFKGAISGERSKVGQPTPTQSAQQQSQAPAPQAAQAFGATPQPDQAPIEPTRQA